MLRNFALISVVGLLGACKPLQDAWNAWTAHGTVEGASYCIKGNKNELLSESTIKVHCLEEFSVDLPDTARNKIDGAGYVTVEGDEIIFDAEYSHPLKSWVVTEITVKVLANTSDEEELPQLQSFDTVATVWLEPDSDYSRRIETKLERNANDDLAADQKPLGPDELVELPWCEEESAARCKGWMIVSAKGLKL